MSDPLGPRWTEGPLPGRPGEDQVVGFLREAPPPTPLTDVAAQRVLRKLRAQPPPATRRWRWVLRPAFIAAVAVVAAGAAAATRALLWRPPVPPIADPPTAVAAPRAAGPIAAAPKPAADERSAVPRPPPAAPRPRRHRHVAQGPRRVAALDPAVVPSRGEARAAAPSSPPVGEGPVAEGSASATPASASDAPAALPSAGSP